MAAMVPAPAQPMRHAGDMMRTGHSELEARGPTLVCRHTGHQRPIPGEITHQNPQFWRAIMQS